MKEEGVNRDFPTFIFTSKDRRESHAMSEKCMRVFVALRI